MTLSPDCESHLLATIRKIPDEATDAAFKFVGDFLRPIAQPTIIDVDRACREAVKRYGRATNSDEPGIGGFGAKLARGAVSPGRAARPFSQPEA